MRLVPNQNIQEVFVSHRGCDLLSHVRSRLHPDPVELPAGNLHLHVWACNVLLNSLKGPIAEPHVKLSVDNDQPQLRPVFALFGPDRHYLQGALILESDGVPSGSEIVRSANYAN